MIQVYLSGKLLVPSIRKWLDIYTEGSNLVLTTEVLA